MSQKKNILMWAGERTTQLVDNITKGNGILVHKAMDEDDFLARGRTFLGRLIILDAQGLVQNLEKLVQKLNDKRQDLHYVILASPGSNRLHKLSDRFRNIDFLEEPVDGVFLSQKLHKLLALPEPAIQVEQGTRSDAPENPNDYTYLWQQSPKMREIMTVIDQVAPTNIKVLIRGESGTGKELVARTIYARSLRHKYPFIKVLCAALPEGLLESELFGHEKGSFTGALRRKPGKFEFSNHGTIFLDEIGEIALSLQAKLLQVLQDGEFSRIGGEADVKVDTRVLAATNKNLEKAVAHGTFREDLYYRLNVVSIYLPALRERKDEIDYLVQHFLETFNKQFNKRYKKISPETMEIFMQYNWPGNVRELENIIKRIVVLEKEDFILNDFSTQSVDDPRSDSPKTPAPEQTPAGTTSLKHVGKEAAGKAERTLIHTILQQTHWNRKKAAGIMKISYKALLYKIKKYDLNRTG